ncbi:pyruvate kinase [Candidatus Gracilibacteria bacterium]|nr:pyruvate kinase [Candidatus Gracilibacteria bacterium]
MKKTNIIATIGPATESEDSIVNLYNSGVNIIRFNFSHANYENAKLIKDRIEKLNLDGKTNLSTLLDTKGPEIRTGDLAQKITFEKGDIIKMYVDLNKFSDDGSSLFCDYPYLLEDLKVGDIVEIDSGLLRVKVLDKKEDYIEFIAGNRAVIGSRRHINLPGQKLRLPGITEKDEEDVIFAIKNNFDFIAQSFVRSRENVLELREILDKNNGAHIKIISKIENSEGVENLDEIIEVSDGIMVARGDLGIEVPIETLPTYQRQMVKKCLNSGKFVIIATHLLESMIENPFPTRAEISDIFNSVMQKADCVMLSGETAMGKYAQEAVVIMKNVIEEAEKQIIYKHYDFSNNGLSQRNIEKKLLIKSAMFMAEELDINAILIFTKTGLLARLAAAFRPNKDIYAFTGNPNTSKYMNILFGIRPYLLGNWTTNQKDNVINSISFLLKNGKITKESKVIAITDIQKDNKEIPALEIITVGDFF